QRAAPLSLLVVGDQMEQDALQEIPETAPLAVGPAQVAVEEAERELLEQLLGGIGIAQYAEQVAAGGPPPMFQQLEEGLPRGLPRLAVRLRQQRPVRADLTQAGVQRHHVLVTPLFREIVHGYRPG